jgi:hypothetical protein
MPAWAGVMMNRAASGFVVRAADPQVIFIMALISSMTISSMTASNMTISSVIMVGGMRMTIDRSEAAPSDPS